MPAVRRAIDYLLLFFKGAAMGAADVVPGVSGGTIALISGIYEEFLNSIRAINIVNLKLLLKGRLAEFWQAINGNFLLVLFTGILFSIFSLAKAVSYGMEHHPLLVWSFFFGLIVASVLWIASKLDGFHWREGLGIIIGAAVAGSLFFVPPMAANDGLIYVFGAGALAICAMILPGISGSFILVLIGFYSLLLEAISALAIPTLMAFGLGCVAGLLMFSRVLSWLLRHYHSVTLSVMVGFLVGSLATVWPWKEALEVMYTESGKEVVLAQQNLMPWEYGERFGVDPQLLPAVLLMVLGVAIVLGLEYIGAKGKPRTTAT